MKSIIKQFKNRKVLLVGDAILDVYIHGTASGTGLGTNVPRIEEKKVEVAFGGNGLIANNILELGGKVFFVSVIGDDNDADYYRSLAHPNLKKYFVVDESRPTIVKKRIFADGNRLLHLNRVDNSDIKGQIERQVIKNIDKIIGKVDAIVVMDPQHGMLTKKVIDHLKQSSKKKNIPLYIDAQISHRGSNHKLYKGAHTMLLNENEAKAIYPEFNPLEGERSLNAIKRELELENVIVKLGGHGSLALLGHTYIKTPATKVKVVDPVGAGDAFLAAFSLGNLDRPKETLYIANTWAALSTTTFGTTPPKKTNLLRTLKEHSQFILMNMGNLKIKIFADGADLLGIKEMAASPVIKGFTTNPTLMRKAGVSDYKAFAKQALKLVGDKPISFEVFADDFKQMEKQALEIASWGKNVYVKIPVTNTEKEFSGPVIKRLSKAGVKLNVTAVMTPLQVEAIAKNLDPKTPAIVSIFAGRIADTGVNPIPIMTEALTILKDKPKAELLWASPRELLDVFHADSVGCHIITATNDILRKLSLIGKDLDNYSLETVEMFYKDAQAAGYSIK